MKSVLAALRLALTLALVLTLGLPAAAQEAPTPEACRTGPIEVSREAYPAADEARLAPLAARIPNHTGRLWQITAPGGQVSHLWGSFHSPHPATLDLPPAFRAILAQARVVALEFDPVPDSREEAQLGASVDWMWIGPFDPAPDRSDIPPRILQLIGNRMDALGWYAEYLAQMTDAGLLTLLLSDPCDDYLAGVLQGQDSYIAQEAYLAGAEVTGLQKPWHLGQQLNDPARAGNARAAVILYAAFLAPELRQPGTRETAFALYRQGRLAEMDLWSSDLVAGVLGADRAAAVGQLTDDYLLIERNGFFTAAARPLLDAGGAVLVVGASHLPGELGMVEMLRDAGYRLDRVALPGEAP